MLNNASPANATPLPVVLALAGTGGLKSSEIISPRAQWAASVGRIAADVAALTFRLPLPRHLRDLFEDTVRREVAAELLPIAHLSDEERHQLEDIAWLAFDAASRATPPQAVYGGEHDHLQAQDGDVGPAADL